MNIYKFLSTLSNDRITYLGNKSKELSYTMNNIAGKDDSLTVIEVFYIISLALLAFINSLNNKEALGSFTEIFNQMSLIQQHNKNWYNLFIKTILFFKLYLMSKFIMLNIGVSKNRLEAQLNSLLIAIHNLIVTINCIVMWK